MRVLLTSHGSTGDIFPVIRLGVELQNRGHVVKFATSPLFKKEIEDAGLQYVQLPPTWSRDRYRELMRSLVAAYTSFGVLKIIHRKALPYIDEALAIIDRELEECDLFVTNYIFGSLASLARKRCIPSASLILAHNVVPRRDLPPWPLKRVKWLPRAIEQGLYRTIWTVIDRMLSAAIRVRVGRHFEKVGVRKLDRFLTQSGDMKLVAVSNVFRQSGELIDPTFHYTGFLRWKPSSTASCSESLDTFCSGEKVPVITFGSVDAENLKVTVKAFFEQWPRDRKVIVQAGWSGISDEKGRANVLNIQQMPHDEVFEHASVIVHHGGAGTTGSALRAGVPQIVVPHLGDQYFFASEIVRLGLGHRLKKENWGEKLTAAIRETEKNFQFVKTAEEIACTVREEEGRPTAAEKLEQLVARHRPSANAQR